MRFSSTKKTKNMLETATKDILDLLTKKRRSKSFQKSLSTNR